METKKNGVRTMTECAIFVAIATVLSLIKLVELPYGGSVTVASMLPVVLISYRHGVKYGLGAGLAFGVIQQLLGLKNLSYVTTWQSVLAVVILDYLAAFTVIGAAGLFRNMKSRSSALAVGSIAACLIRYVCHVISGATVWAGLSIPTKAALLYSFAYNATYLVPETIVLAVSAYYVGSVFDLGRDMPVRVARERSGGLAFRFAAGFVAAAAAIADTALVFSKLQDGETGEFYIKGLSDVNWTAVAIVTTACAVTAAALIFASRRVKGGERA